MKTFNELGLNEKLVKGLSKKNITKPTKVQSLTIEKILDHKDILVNSETVSAAQVETTGGEQATIDTSDNSELFGFTVSTDSEGISSALKIYIC